MINNPLMFYATSFLIVLFAVLAISFRNIFYSLICAILVFFMTAIMFYNLGSEYNAVIQFAVYGFAVPVILGIAVMFTSAKKEKPENINIKYIAILAGGIFILGLIYLCMISLTVVPDEFDSNLISDINSYNNIRQFSSGIYLKYVLAFEVLSLILTIIAGGLTIFKRRNDA